MVGRLRDHADAGVRLPDLDAGRGQRHRTAVAPGVDGTPVTEKPPSRRRCCGVEGVERRPGRPRRSSTGVSFERRRRRVHRADRVERCRQDDAAPGHPRPAATERRPGPDRGRATAGRGAGSIGYVPQKALFDAGRAAAGPGPGGAWASTGTGSGCRCRHGQAPGGGRRDAARGGGRALRRGPGRPALRWRAATGADRPRPDQPAPPAAAGRAAGQPRPGQRDRRSSSCSTGSPGAARRRAALRPRDEPAPAGDGPHRLPGRRPGGQRDDRGGRAPRGAEPRSTATTSTCCTCTAGSWSWPGPGAGTRSWRPTPARPHHSISD